MREGLCQDCGEHCESSDIEDSMTEDEKAECEDSSNCCGAAILGDGDGYDEDYGSDR